MPGADGADGATGPQGVAGPGNARYADDGASGWGIEPIDAVEDLVAIPDVKSASTVKSVIVYGEDTAVTFSVYSVAVTTGAATLLGSGTVGTLLDITDFVCGDQDNHLVLRFAASTTAQTIYGGKLYEDDAGTTVHELGLTPRHFLVNNDG